MKEFQSTVGGRHAYNTDFKNLQELALAMQEIFHECGSNFVISGCNVTVGNTISVSEGYVYINNRVCKVAASSGLQATNLYIVASQKNGDSIPYADGNIGVQYIEYYAECVNNSSVNTAYIAYNNNTQSFPNLATAFFNYYTVCKKADNQSIDNLTIQQTLTVLKQLLVPQGVMLDNNTASIIKDGDSIAIKNGNYSLCFSSTGVCRVKYKDEILFSFSNTSGTGRVTFDSIKVEQEISTNKLIIGGINIEDKLTPLGVINMWAGPIEKIPQNYKLCDGQALEISQYTELYNVIGETFNTAPLPTGGNWRVPSSGTFRIPDLRQRFIAGYDPNDSQYNTIGTALGEKYHTLSINEIPSHAHNVDDYYYLEDWDTVSRATSIIYGSYQNIGDIKFGAGASDHNNNVMLYKNHPTEYSGSGGAHENRPPYYVLAYIIKVK